MSTKEDKSNKPSTPPKPPVPSVKKPIATTKKVEVKEDKLQLKPAQTSPVTQAKKSPVEVKPIAKVPEVIKKPIVVEAAKKSPVESTPKSKVCLSDVNTKKAESTPSSKASVSEVDTKKAESTPSSKVSVSEVDTKKAEPPIVDLGLVTVEFDKRKFTKVKLLGTGAYSEVYRVEDAKGKKFAVKVIKVTETSAHYQDVFLNREIKLLQRLDHPNITQILEISTIPPKTILIVMEYADSGTLDTWLKDNGGVMPENPQANSVFWKITNAIDYMHNRLGMAHRDLKLENILLDRKTEPKLTDFSFAMDVPSGQDRSQCAKSFCGSIYYIAPELLAMTMMPSIVAYDPFKYDVWSLGIVLFILLNGRLPFEGADVEDKASVKAMFKKQVKKEWKIRSKYKDIISAEAVDLIGKMLEPEPALRPTITDVRSHEWLKDAKARQGEVNKQSKLI